MLLHDLANTTQYLVGLNSLIATDPRLLATAHAGLSESTDEVLEIGFVLGLVAREAGADLLFENGRRDGLDLLLAWVRKCLRREGRDLALPAGEFARVAIDGPDHGRDAAFAAAKFVFAAGCSAPRGHVLRIELQRVENAVALRCFTPRAESIAACARECLSVLAGLEFEGGEESCALIFPARVFEPILNA
ncbi:MAG: hypothetical protein JNL28_13445 [Planctomycetes bacterium]|nr:hypothetical protein [Planctomycetota bacterium]